MTSLIAILSLLLHHLRLLSISLVSFVLPISLQSLNSSPPPLALLFTLAHSLLGES